MEENKEAEDEIQKILDRNNLKLGYTFEFPIYKILPDEVKLALSVLKNHGMRVVIELKPKSDKN